MIDAFLTRRVFNPSDKRISGETFAEMAAGMAKTQAEVLYVHNQPHLCGEAARAFIESLPSAPHLHGLNMGELRLGSEELWELLLDVLPRTNIYHMYIDNGKSLACTDHPGERYVKRLRAVLLENQRGSGVDKADKRVRTWAYLNPIPGRKGYTV